MSLKTPINFLLQDLQGRSRGEICKVLIEGLGVLLLISRVFYQSMIAMIFLLPLMIPICRRGKRIQDNRYKKELLLQFKEVMNSILTALRAGYASENAFREARKDMEYLYGRKSAICRELSLIEKGMDNNIPLEKLLHDFGRRSMTAEIMEFAEVFTIAKRSGGSMTDILTRTSTLIQNRIDVENEISILLSAKKLEQGIMDLVPVIIILYISVTSRGFFDCLYHNPTGILFMTACLLVYGTAFLISEKIMDISV